MVKKNKKCIVCQKETEDSIKKYHGVFCSHDCLKKYERLLEEAKKKVNLDQCC